MSKSIMSVTAVGSGYFKLLVGGISPLSPELHTLIDVFCCGLEMINSTPIIQSYITGTNEGNHMVTITPMPVKQPWGLYIYIYIYIYVYMYIYIYWHSSIWNSSLTLLILAYLRLRYGWSLSILYDIIPNPHTTFTIGGVLQILVVLLVMVTQTQLYFQAQTSPYYLQHPQTAHGFQEVSQR